MKNTAMDELNEVLLSAGMSQNEADHLLSRFLEEEAYDYVDYMETVKEVLRLKEKEKTGLLS